MNNHPNSLPPSERFKLAQALADQEGITVGQAFKELAKNGIEATEHKLRDPEHNFSDHYDYSTGNVTQIYYR